MKTSNSQEVFYFQKQPSCGKTIDLLTIESISESKVFYSKINETLAQVYSSPVRVSSYAPETPLLLFTRVYLSFFFKMIKLLIMIKNIFILFLFLYNFFETFARMRKGLHILNLCSFINNFFVDFYTIIPNT